MLFQNLKSPNFVDLIKSCDQVIVRTKFNIRIITGDHDESYFLLFKIIQYLKL